MSFKIDNPYHWPIIIPDSAFPGAGIAPLFIEHQLTLAEIQALGAVNLGFVPFAAAALPANARILSITIGDGVGDAKLTDAGASPLWRVGVATDLGVLANVSDCGNNVCAVAATLLIPYTVGEPANTPGFVQRGYLFAPAGGRTYSVYVANTGVTMANCTAGTVRVRVYYFVDASLA